MSMTWAKGILVGAVVATTGGAFAGYQMVNNAEVIPSDIAEVAGFAPVTPVALPEFAEVLQVSQLMEEVPVPRQVCEDVTVTHQAPPRDQNQIAGTLSGAVIGGILGNQVGGGTGKKVATVAGAAVGGFTGKKLQERAQSNDTYTTVEKQCHTVTDYKKETVGYDVTYRIGEAQGQVRMDKDPGERIALVNGELALN